MDIIHEFEINASLEMVFTTISTPEGLDKWWTKEASGKPGLNETYQLGFGPGYNWAGTVTAYSPNQEFELTISHSESDWNGTKVHFLIREINDKVRVQFAHKGWPESNEHYRISCYCWAMYLRVMRRHLEHNEFVAYENRLDV